MLMHSFLTLATFALDENAKKNEITSESILTSGEDQNT